MTGNTEGTPEPGGAVETRRGASVNPQQLQRDYDAIGSLRLLAEKYGTNRSTMTRRLVAAGIPIRKRGCNGSQHSEAWYAAYEKRRAERPDEIHAIMAKARATRWADPAQHERASARLQEVWDTDQGWRDRHQEKLRKLWDDPERPLARQWDDPAQRERQRQAWLRRITATRGQRGTPPGEAALLDALMRASISFTSSAVMLDGLYVVDVLIHQQPLVLEADGVSHKIGNTAERDAERERLIEAAGYRIVRFPYRRLADDADDCVASLGLQSEENPVFDVRDLMTALSELREVRKKRRADSR